MTEIIPSNNSPLSLPKCRVHPRGLIFEDNISFEDWEKVGDVLQRVNDSIQFLLGDWANYGEKAFGEAYSQALDSKKMSYGTFANYKYVANKVEFSRRRENLPYTIHHEVAQLDPRQQDEVLDLAERDELSAKEVRSLVKEMRVQPTTKDSSTSKVVLKHGEINNVIQDMREESINHIVSDPPHSTEFLNVWDDIGKAAQEVLKPGGFCITYISTYHLKDVLPILSQYLTYYWQIILIRKHEDEKVHTRQINTQYKAALVFCKEPIPTREEYVPDTIECTHNPEGTHYITEVHKVLDLFTHEGDVILDPTVGRGEIVMGCVQANRNIVGIDKNAERIKTLQEKLNMKND